ncbi:MAG: hypothetical protein L0226_05265 [Acidobacteria bacterium]|nr:hypothetical protein [Acidobacteriota bacterium]
MNFCRLFLIWVLILVPSATEAAQTRASFPQTKQSDPTPRTLPDNLPARDFARLIRELSEAGGSFYSDNLLSNETSYLHIIDKLKLLGASGGAYIGVGPEQNFTYIANVRPRIAFIIDIRHMAVIQHLMYKAIFHLSPDRAKFLSRLLSRPLIKGKAPAAGASLNDLLVYFNSTAPDEKFFAANLAEFRRLIQEDFQYQLAELEQKDLEYILRSFKNDGLSMTYQWNGNYLTGYFPTLKEVIVATDLNGKQGNFLASNEDFNIVRNLQRKNLIIPITGNFAGQKALAAVGDYLRKYELTVSVFYLSNVEQYLFEDGVFADFARNVGKLPVNEQSLFIRSVLSRFEHPALLPGHQFATLLQRIPIFLKDYDEGRYRHYSSLINTNYIAAGQK